MQPKPGQIWRYKYNKSQEIQLSKGFIKIITKENRWYAYEYVRTPFIVRLRNFFKIG